MLKAVAAASLFIAVTSVAQQVQATAAKPSLRELTIENIFDPKQRLAFSGSPQSGFVWLDDKSFTWPRTDSSGSVVEQLVYDTESGKTHLLFDNAKLEAALSRVANLSADEAKRIPKTRSWTFSPDKKSALLTLADDLYTYNFASGMLVRLTSSSGGEEEASFSPDGRLVAFVRKNNLYVVDLATQREKQLTTDGTDDIINGTLDWVYQEEVFGRGNFHAYWWSPDSTNIAFLHLDERPVKRFTIVDHLPTMQSLELEPYPKAGFPNPIAKLFTVAIKGDKPKEIATTSYGNDILLVGVTWSPDSRRVLYQVQDREQTWLDLDATTIADGTTTKLIHETTKAWVEPSPSPEWLSDGSFLWLSERSGFRHLYHYDGAGKLLAQVTNGPWEVRTLHGVDQKNHTIYFSGTERTSIGIDVYRIAMDGSGLKRLSGAPGTHKATFNPSFSHYLDTWTDVETPPQTSLVRNDGKTMRIVDENEPSLLRQFRRSKPEFVQVRTRDGFVMEAEIIKPLDFDPAKKYPVYEHTYSGPHSQQVLNDYQRTQYLWHQYLAQHGIIVWVCDNRTASGKGAESAWPVYKHFGDLELRDLEDGLKWLTSQPYVDASRVMLNGWSFGGFMTTYALTHSTMWSAGIAGGSVTDWHDYDSIYTERYMLTPEHNDAGYRESAPRWSAKDLHGNLLLLHGLTDDNVHVQNTIQIAYELQKANKVFGMMLYPKSRHGVTDPLLITQMRSTMWKFIQENLLATH